jgi:hypothetical protein
MGVGTGMGEGEGERLIVEGIGDDGADAEGEAVVEVEEERLIVDGVIPLLLLLLLFAGITMAVRNC